MLTFSNFNSRTTKQPEQENEHAALMERYWQQVAEGDLLQEMTRQQLETSARIMERQSALLDRWEQVIDKQEELAE